MVAPLHIKDEILKYGLGINKIYNEDCLIGMEKIKDKSIDMILCDLPYGTTQNKWDCIIPLNNYIEVQIKNKIVCMTQENYKIYCFDNGISLDKFKLNWKQQSKKGLWAQYKRIIKDNGAIILTSAQPFTSQLIQSNKTMFKYSLVWDKKNTTGFLNAKKQPLRRHEDICVFYKKPPVYNPKMQERGKARAKGGKNRVNRGCYGDYSDTNTFNNLYYPTSILEISNANKKNIIHPTQKPEELFQYLIETYSNKGEIILDNCMGSGTTAIASLLSARNYIGFELNKDYFNKSIERINCVNNK